MQAVELVVVGDGRAYLLSQNGLALRSSTRVKPARSVLLSCFTVSRCTWARGGEICAQVDLPRPVPISVLCLQARCLRGWTRGGKGRVAGERRLASTSQTAHNLTPLASDCAWLLLHSDIPGHDRRPKAMAQAGSKIRGGRDV